MSLLTIAPATSGTPEPAAYYLGRADAYDDTHTRTVDQLVALAGIHTDYADLDYARGYLDRVIELRMEDDVMAAVEAELAWADAQATAER